MKKNISINLFGELYNIDEDAYALLGNYLDNMKSYFSKRDGGDEIADDIEHRVAEHMWALKDRGQNAVDIDTVKKMIESIGDPTQMDDAADNASGAGEAKEGATGGAEAAAPRAKKKGFFRPVSDYVGSHRFYRDGKEKMAGGVISGLCHYCGGGDPLVWRLLTALVLIVTCTQLDSDEYWFISHVCLWVFWAIIVIYVLLWLLAPMARTTEERLCMKGEEVTPESISRAVIDEAAEKETARTPRRGFTVVSRVGEVLGFALRSILFILFALFSAVAFIFMLLGIFFAVGSTDLPKLIIHDDNFFDIAAHLPMFGVCWVILGACCLLATLLPFVCVLRTFAPNVKPMSFNVRASLTVAWLLAASIAMLTPVCMSFVEDYKWQTERERNAQSDGCAQTDSIQCDSLENEGESQAQPTEESQR